MVVGLLAPPEPYVARKTLRSVQYVENHEDAPELTLSFGAEYDGVYITIKLEGAISSLAASLAGESGQDFAISLRRKGRYE